LLKLKSRKKQDGVLMWHIDIWKLKLLRWEESWRGWTPPFGPPRMEKSERKGSLFSTGAWTPLLLDSQVFWGPTPQSSVTLSKIKILLPVFIHSTIF
jgi:hypothetical protein